jgi:subtilisin family serine protease
MRRVVTIGLLGAAVAACADSTVPSAPVAGPEVSLSRAAGQNTAQYIVVLRDGVTDVDGEVRRLSGKHLGRLNRTYRAALKGMAVELTPEAAEALRAEPSVALVEADQPVSITTTQSGATWGLDRIDQRALPLSTTYTYTPDGSGVTAYIIDTGMRFTHAEFTGRISSGFDAVDGGSADDCHGHGTHVAGTVGGTTYGVAKAVALVAVRVLNCQGSGTNAGVIAGIDWVTANRVLPAVANMSLGGGFSSAVNTAVQNSIAAGVTYAVAAGNSNANACNYSPASAPNALTVGSTTITDAKSSFSNHGSCVDIHAPGSSITSAWSTNNTATNTISGTSMASPHVAGAAALYLDANPGASPAAVAAALTGNATSGVITGLPSGTVNLLLYTGDEAAPPPPTDPAPVAAFTTSCSGLTCTFNGSSSTNETGYSWTFTGGIAPGTGMQITRTFSARTSYTVTLTVTGTGGTASTSRTLNCNPKKCV